MRWLSWSRWCRRQVAEFRSQARVRTFRRQFTIAVEQLELRTLLAANLAPDINDQAFFIRSDASNGTPVGAVLATDPDTPAQTLTFQITNGNLGAFAINPTSGVISVVDVTLLNSAILTVEVTDNGQPSKSNTALIAINVNHPPVIADQAFTVPTSPPAGSSVGTVLATDPDFLQTLTYSILSGNENAALAINATTGAITVANTALLAEQTTLTVQVSDNALLQDVSTASVTINQNSPPVINDQTFVVPANATSGFSVGTATAFDQDVARGQKLTYTIVHGNSTGAFAIDPTTGEIFLADLNAFNTLGPSHQLTVQVQDNAVRPGTAQATITIVQNHSPVVNDQVFPVLSSATVNSVIGTVVSSDPDAGQTRTFVITDGNNGAFAISPSGVLTVANTSLLNALGLQTDLTVEVTDNGTPALSDTAQVSINLNHVPILNDRTVTVLSTIPEGSTVTTISATDATADAGQALSYFITSGNQTGAFAIDSVSGIIKVANKAAFTALSFPTPLTVEVRDNGTPQGVDTATITVGLNHPPSVKTQTFSILSTVAAGTAVGTVTASDSDASQVLTYSIVTGNNGTFAINPSTGVISVADTSLLNALTLNTSLTVQVVDNGSPTGVGTANVTIIRNSPPVISEQTLLVPTVVTQGVGLGMVTAFDPDTSSGQTLSYAIVSGNSLGTFSINPANGQLSIANLAAFNTLGISNVVAVQVQDSNSPPASAQASITIIGTHNSDTPVINNQTFAAPVNVQAGTTLGTVLAFDADLAGGQTLTYLITAGNETGAFGLNPQTGELKIVNPDAFVSLTLPFNLTVQVRGNGLQSASATITVTGNHPPLILPQTFTIPPINSQGTVIGTVTAHDPDSMQTLSYFIASGNAAGAFSIDSATGTIKVQNSAALNGITYPVSLTVQVIDSGTPQGASTATITLNGNHPPVVAPVTFVVPATGSILGTLVATDADVGQKLNYLIEAGNSSGTMSLDPTTGTLTIADGMQTTFNSLLFPVNLQVKVVDNGNPQASTTVIVTVVRPLTNATNVIQFDAQAFTIPQAITPGAVLGTVFAFGKELTPGDEPPALRFALANASDSTAFSIDSSTGILTRVTALPAASGPITVPITVSELNDPSQSVTRAITVNVVTTNNHAPTAQNLETTIQENSVPRTSVGKIVAASNDPGQKLSYSIVTSSVDKAFSIDSKTGEITVTDDSLLDYEQHRVIFLNVKVTDDGTGVTAATGTTSSSPISLTTFVTVKISLSDQNPEPLTLNLADTPHAYHARANPVAIDSLAAFQFGDVPTSDYYSRATLTVSDQLVSQGKKSMPRADTLSVSNNGGSGIHLVGTSIVYNGMTIGTFDGGKKVALSVRFNALATTAGIEALIRAINFGTTGPTGTRVVTMLFKSNNLLHPTSTSASRQIDVVK
ncbi:MAG: hypothetical protein JWM11_6829 [Planctomycetaceae bacterium]|nr:hypothetical protein [Planctomycetaceae bacterium]